MTKIFATWIIFLFLVAPTFAEEVTPPELKGVALEDKLGEQIDLEIPFIDEEGQIFPLRHYISGEKPVLLLPVYYECPTLCGLVLNGVLQGFKDLKWNVGKEFEVVTFSINPLEKPETAKTKKANYCGAYGRDGVEEGWRFLTGTEEAIRSLTEQIGFQYQYDAKEKQYAHPALLYILTPEGKIARVLSGVEFPERDLRLAMVEASEGKIGNIIDHALLFCYRYDPKKSKYTLFASNLMKGSAAGTVLLLGFVLFRGNRKKKQ